LAPAQGSGACFLTEETVLERVKFVFQLIKYFFPGFYLWFLFSFSVLSCRGDEELPVLLQRSTERLTTTAFSEDETRRFFEQVFHRRLVKTSGGVSSFAEVSGELERPALTGKNRLSALLHWESDLVCQESGSYEFFSTQADSAWALFLNGRYCGGWQDMPAKAQLPPGIHRLQFLAVQKNGAVVPGLKALKKEADSFQEQPLQLQRPQETSFARLDAAPAALRQYILSWQLKGRYHFLATDRYLDWYQKNDESELAEGLCLYRTIDGQRLALPAKGELYVDGREGMSLEWQAAGQTEVFPALPCWPLALPVHIRISLGEAPLILSASEPISARIHQTWPTRLPEGLKDAFQLRCRQYDQEGALLSDELISRGYQEVLDCSIKTNAAAQLLNWQAEIGGIPAAESVEMRIVRPGSFPEHIELRGNHLLVSGRRAVLQCDPLRKRIDGGKLGRQTPELSIKLYYFDYGLGDTHRAGKGGHSHSRLFRKLRGYSAGRVLLPETAGSEPELKSVAAFAQLLNMRPEMALLNLGEQELKAGRTALQWCRQMLFFAQTCLAAGIEPVLLAYPEMPGIDQAVSRQSALLIKELGLTLGITTVDLYSQRILEQVDTQAWFVDAFAEHQARSWQGRSWQMEKVVDNLLSNRFAEP
jgi:hypothetical protein